MGSHKSTEKSQIVVHDTRGSTPTTEKGGYLGEKHSGVTRVYVTIHGVI